MFYAQYQPDHSAMVWPSMSSIANCNYNKYQYNITADIPTIKQDFPWKILAGNVLVQVLALASFCG